MNRPIRDITDIVAEVPGVAIEYDKTGAGSIYMRGMATKYTLILVDGKRVNMSDGFDSNGFDATTGFLPPPSMIERVEVIKGPASLIYGTGALGGVINIITKKGGDKPSGSFGIETRLQQDHSTWGNTYGVNGNVFVPIDEYISINVRGKHSFAEKNKIYRTGIAGYNPTPNYRNADGSNYFNPYSGWSPSGYVNSNLGARFNLNLSDANKFYFDVDYGYQRLGTLNTAAQNYTAVREYHKYNFVINHDGAYEWGNINSFLQYANTQRVPHKGSLNIYSAPTQGSNTSIGNIAAANRVDLGASRGTPDRSQLTENQAFNYQTTFMKNFDFNDKGSMLFQAGPSVFYEKLFTRNTRTSKSAYQLGLFAEGEYFINDFISSTAGLRINRDNTYGNFFSPRVYVNTYPSDWLTLKAGISNGLSVPALATRFDNPIEGGLRGGTNGTVTLYPNKDLEAERSLNYEISAIVENNYATLILTGFLTDFSNKITTRNDFATNSTLPGGLTCSGLGSDTLCGVYVNVDKARSAGIEFEIKSKALLENFIPKGIYFDLAYGFTDTEQRSGVNKGKALNDVPRHNIATRLSYKNWGFDTYLRYVAKLNTPTDNHASAQAVAGKYYADYHIVDLGTNYRFKNGINIGAMVNNLLNKNFIDQVPYSSGGDGRGSGTNIENRYQKMLPGRNLWLTLRADF